MTPKTVLTLIASLSLAAVVLVGCGDDSSTVISPGPAVDTVPPASPTGVRVNTTVTTVELSWTANAEPDLAGYTLQRSFDGGETWHALSTSLLATNSYSDYKNQTAEYRVAAEDLASNQSAYSAQVGYRLATPKPKYASSAAQPGR